MFYLIRSRTLRFRRPARTSRGEYLIHQCHYVGLVGEDNQLYLGEASPLPGLSIDDVPDFKEQLQRIASEYCDTQTIDNDDRQHFPAAVMAVECAARCMALSNAHRLYDNPFSRGEVGIPINGLVWMDSLEAMRQAAEQKVEAGFRCVKLKIGSHDFDSELELVRHLRSLAPDHKLTIRLDANGAFTPNDALHKLERLAPLGIHSIEQPLRAGQWAQQADICKHSPIPIALDEELIGVCGDEQQRLLDTIQPQFIVIKPTLHGGLTGAEQWRDLAAQRHIGSWLTSALESNLGLNAVAQLAAHLYGNQTDMMPQGLGTGQLFEKNAPSTLTLKGDVMWYDTEDKV